MIFEQIFEQIGLNEIDARVYDHLLQVGVGTPSLIAKASKVSRENTYYILKKLVELGLVTQIPGAKTLTFQVASSENLQRLFDEKERKLSASRALLSEAVNLVNSTLSANTHAPAVRYYEDISGVKQAYYDFLGGEKKGEIFGLTNSKWPKELDEFFVNERLKTKIKLQLLIVRGERAMKFRTTSPKELRETRIMPSLDFPLGTYFAVFKNRVMIVNRPEVSEIVGVGIVIEHTAIAHAFRSMFSMIWDSAKNSKS
ncbi:MAG: hypothetical protein KBC15_02790 [Candidatus Levybacteria bacterium]|nr:hypothetical protein [Candidatus Levybacteria bacterium]